MLSYIIFCYLAAAITFISLIQEDAKAMDAPVLWFGTLFAPISITLALLVVPLWYLVKFTRTRIRKGR